MRRRWRRRPRLAPCGLDQAVAMADLHRTAFPRGWSGEEMGHLLEDPCACAVGAFLGERLVGFSLGRTAADEAEVLSLVVSETARQRGLGAELLEALEGVCAERGARAIFLEVSERNRPAMTLYYRADYRQVGRRPRYYEDGASALTMRKAL